MAGNRPASGAARRAGARHRYRQQTGNLRVDPADGGQRLHRAAAFEGVVRIDRLERSHPCLPPGPARGRDRRRRHGWRAAAAADRGGRGRGRRPTDQAGERCMTRTDTAPPLAGSANRRPGRRIRLPAETGAAVGLAAMLGLLGWLQPSSVDAANLSSLLEQAALPGLLAIGMVFVLTMREIDLSAGAVFHLTATFTALLVVAGMNPWLAALAGIAAGAGLGLINGLLVIALRLPALLVTLGTWWMIQGLSLVIGKGQTIAPPGADGSVLATLSGKAFVIVPVTGIVFVVLAMAMHVVLHRTRFGYRVQAVGSNPRAAAYAGIPTDKVRVLTLVLMGAMAGLAGVIHLGAQGAIAPGDGGTFALLAITAAIIGGTSLSGGNGSVIGAVIGMLVLQAILSAMTLLGVDAIWAAFATGALIVLALAIDRLVNLWRNRRAGHGEDNLLG
ncbi:ABC transporter permease [Mesorhizobium sp. M7D.F.Ca.US.005.01.1.1]|nr:ABC transporter permease [Mesorhizobium sp. M7D.F.Ca.US.005.01.1.1]